MEESAIQKGFENLKDGTEYDNLRQHCLIPSESAKTYDSPAVKSIFVTFAESNKGNSKPYQNKPSVPRTSVVVKQNCNTVSKNQSYLYDHLLTKGARPLLKE